ncbi:hypothetical protein BJV85_002782 [Clostridium acetobutylicum]|uniref:Uncharacterized protein n=1 Tax=Clostridium acetobutylicum (strain ATCC 824 / DSM 792 / JCM 1419 / IAM 19013 / LMG 5710 / NBRC 13948 / NRRL B-527 / VKM B-1787 / 2291 / W) TaxID=272562 RepID=Q97JQ7_CLOAB|nr:MULTISPECIES: hypothetical protein [Clostridium]AAK79188.1 Hypothetical protein CA_C1216 [Clostridium acetobutylicum ATCC 824]ADZ20266.1 Conserved hypothetical protein [Clostridium acetobutylicum EA 2018]AEI31718.1 hypothetical protein SMB_G1236 [Clostridium acetobutylicum DSM 1731]AWV81562.1 hypothetical protein DK921_15975 [Clostridium acetobutylicum]MBC2393202.1 hypothetical protein [Clostridium acetobutylicum]
MLGKLYYRSGSCFGEIGKEIKTPKGVFHIGDVIKIGNRISIFVENKSVCSYPFIMGREASTIEDILEENFNNWKIVKSYKDLKDGDIYFDNCIQVFLFRGELKYKKDESFYGYIGDYAFKNQGEIFRVGDVIDIICGKNFIIKNIKNEAFINGFKGSSLNGKFNNLYLGYKEKFKSFSDIAQGEKYGFVEAKLFNNSQAKQSVVLKVELRQMSNLIIGRILYQDEEIIKRGSFRFKATNGINLKSIDSPYMSEHNLYLKGTDDKGDKMFFSYDAETIEHAKEVIKNINVAIEELNENYKKEERKEEKIKTSLNNLFNIKDLKISVDRKKNVIIIKMGNVSRKCLFQDINRGNFSINRVIKKLVLILLEEEIERSER